MVVMRWQNQAACNGTDLPWVEDVVLPQMAVICAGCPVRLDCLMEALTFEDYEDVGVWGGTDIYQRRRLRSNKVTVSELWTQQALS